MENIARLIELQMLGTYGFYESVDFSPPGLPLGETHAIVRSYMAHHQGMILLSLLNYLHDDVMVRRFHADPLVRSVELLLQEKVPYDAPLEVGAAGGRARAPDAIPFSARSSLRPGVCRCSRPRRRFISSRMGATAC